MNTEKNSYVITYSVVMVVLAAILLAGASILLKPAQQQNEKVDKMEQILRSVHLSPSKSEVVAIYKNTIKKELLINQDGQVVESFDGDKIAESEAFDANTELAFKTHDFSKLPVYVAEVEGKVVYILPLNGAGLWNKIWGYLAVEAADHSTIYGADFGNAGETPGLGAEISTPAFSGQFIGKQLFRDEQFKNITVVKHGASVEGQDYVDGISGGTLTSNGVKDMLNVCVAPYQKFLETYNAQ